jgi:HTH-like domain
MREISSLILRMAAENPRWGYSRIQGALKNLGHTVARSTVAKILRDNGIPPTPHRPSSWRTFLRAHWGAIAGADFFTSEVWTPRGLVTYYTLVVIDLQSRRVAPERGYRTAPVGQPCPGRPGSRGAGNPRLQSEADLYGLRRQGGRENSQPIERPQQQPPASPAGLTPTGLRPTLAALAGSGGLGGTSGP